MCLPSVRSVCWSKLWTFHFKGGGGGGQVHKEYELKVGQTYKHLSHHVALNHAGTYVTSLIGKHLETNVKHLICITRCPCTHVNTHKSIGHTHLTPSKPNAYKCGHRISTVIHTISITNSKIHLPLQYITENQTDPWPQTWKHVYIHTLGEH